MAFRRQGDIGARDHEATVLLMCCGLGSEKAVSKSVVYLGKEFLHIADGWQDLAWIGYVAVDGEATYSRASLEGQ